MCSLLRLQKNIKFLFAIISNSTCSFGYNCEWYIVVYDVEDATVSDHSG